MNRVISFYLVLSGSFVLLMMLFGTLMLLSQGEIIHLDMGKFYEIMTMHGTGMIGFAALGASAVMWYFLKQYVELSKGILYLNLAMALLGAVLVVIGIFGFDFAGAWTFLYPLPAISGGAWGETGAALYLIGMLLIGTGFLLLYLDIARAIGKAYGGLGNGLGWRQLFGKDKGYGPPAAVVAGTMVSIVNITAIAAGAVVLVMSLINLFVPSFTVDPLLAKNLTYAFGHIFANSIIYMAVIAVYEILPRATNRPWKANKVFLFAWNCSTLFTIIIYPHHLLMDTVMPRWALILGQALSYMNGIPVLVVTAYGALMILYRSGIRWSLASGFMTMAMFGWVAGVIPAIVDATIRVNYIMHNTKWVPGHFHMYMGLGAISMIFGFMYFANEVHGGFKERAIDRWSFWLYSLFFFGMSGSFLFSGASSSPRRWAEHMPQWVPYDVIGAVFSVFIAAATVVFLIRYVSVPKQEIDK